MTMMQNDTIESFLSGFNQQDKLERILAALPEQEFFMTATSQVWTHREQLKKLLQENEWHFAGRDIVIVHLCDQTMMVNLRARPQKHEKEDYSQKRDQAGEPTDRRKRSRGQNSR